MPMPLSGATEQENVLSGKQKFKGDVSSKAIEYFLSKT
jgi:hypothetical protein